MVYYNLNVITSLDNLKVWPGIKFVISYQESFEVCNMEMRNKVMGHLEI